MRGMTMAALALTGVLLAQDRPQPREGQDRPPAREGQDRPRMDMAPPMIGASPSSMIVHEGKIFIFTGGSLYKVDPVEMKVLGEVQVVRPRVRPAVEVEAPKRAEPRPDGR